MKRNLNQFKTDVFSSEEEADRNVCLTTPVERTFLSAQIPAPSGRGYRGMVLL